MKKTVFYSWQSDLLNGTNRSLIENALQDAAKEIVEDESIDIEPAIDRDTQGVAGAPDIATTIFSKINSADMFVADISTVGNLNKRSTPNPNVLIELGYALKSLGHERIVLVFNEASGEKEKLPFDLRTRRILTYTCSDTEENRATVRKSLTKDLKSALLFGFAHPSQKTQTSDILETLKKNAPSKKIELRHHLASVLNELQQIEPKMARDGGSADDLLLAISKTKNLVMEFSKLSETVALMGDIESAKEIFQWFGKIVTKYDPLLVGDGQYWNSDGDFYKFVGHELFINFMFPFLKEKEWGNIQEILKGILVVGPTLHHSNERKVSWTEISENIPSVADKGKLTNRLSLHADLLEQRYENVEFSSRISFNEFMSTDFFLFLHQERGWYPRSALYLSFVPQYILDAVDYPTAMKMCHSLGLTGIEKLKEKLKLSQKEIRYDWAPPVEDSDINAIGSKGGALILG